MNLPRIPKRHPLLEYSYLVMLRDLRQTIARKLWKERKIRRIKNESAKTDN